MSCHCTAYRYDNNVIVFIYNNILSFKLQCIIYMHMTLINYKLHTCNVMTVAVAVLFIHVIN